MKIGVLGGSFNPVHIGHLMLASYLKQFEGFDEVWLMLSPLNPLKANSAELIPDVTRLRMLDIALKGAEARIMLNHVNHSPAIAYLTNSKLSTTRPVTSDLSKLRGSIGLRFSSTAWYSNLTISRFNEVTYSCSEARQS